MTQSAQKRKRDDHAALEQRRQIASNPSPPPQEVEGFEEMLEMVAAGRIEETGATPQALAAMFLRMIKMLREKKEIEKALVAMRMARVEAEKQNAAELLRRRDVENQALKQAQHKQDVSSDDSSDWCSD